MAALSGLRVLELTHFLAGPYAGLVLADMGADVVKIEDPTHPDEARGMGPFDSAGESLYFRSLNWGKRSLGVRLGTSAGREVVLDLARTFDVVVDNFRPGVLAKLGLSHAALNAVNPRIITCSLTGFGENGPYANRPGYDYTIQALSGVMSLAGEPNGPPTKAGISYLDHAGGLSAALAVCGAVIGRARTGTGTHVDVGLIDVQTSMLSYLAAWSLNASLRPARQHNSAHPSLVPAQNFRTADGWIALFVGNDAMWRRLVALLGDEALAATRYATREDRLRHAEGLCERLQQLFLTDTSATWSERLATGGVACAPVNGIDEALADPHVRSRELVVGDAFQHVRGPVIGLSAASTTDAPRLGQHTYDVLRELGYESERVSLLESEGAVASAGPGPN